MKILIRLVLSVFFCTLISCAKYPGITYTKAEFAICKASCNKKVSKCNRLCSNNCAQCRSKAFSSTNKSYNMYLHEQRLQGLRVARELNSYRDPLQCRKITCNCPADYQVCMQLCGGVIYKQLRVASVCQ